MLPCPRFGVLAKPPPGPGRGGTAFRGMWSQTLEVSPFQTFGGLGDLPGGECGDPLRIFFSIADRWDSVME